MLVTHIGLESSCIPAPQPALTIEHVDGAPRCGRLALQALQPEEQRQLVVTSVQQVAHLEGRQAGRQAGTWLVRLCSADSSSWEGKRGRIAEAALSTGTCAQLAAEGAAAASEWLQRLPLQTHLDDGGGAPGPAVLPINQACQAEGAPRLAQVTVQVSHCNQARHCRQCQRRRLWGRGVRLRVRRARGGGALCVQRVHEGVHEASP